MRSGPLRHHPRCPRCAGGCKGHGPFRPPRPRPATALSELRPCLARARGRRRAAWFRTRGAAPAFRSYRNLIAPPGDQPRGRHERRGVPRLPGRRRRLNRRRGPVRMSGHYTVEFYDEDAEKRLGTGSDTGEPPIRPQRELGFLCACDNGSQGHMQGREVLPRQRGPACAPREAAQPERLHPRAHAPRHVRVASGTSPSQLRADAAIVRVQ